MKLQVDMGICQNYGQCVFAAPEVFDLDEAGDLVYREDVDESARPDVEAAAMACPVQAITLAD